MTLPVLRPATAQDAPALADLFWRSREANRASIPMVVHPRASVLPFVAGLVERCEVWLAEVDGVPAALLVLDGDDLEHLYVDPAHTGAGLGSRLVSLAKERRPRGLTLWTFVSNAGAQRFYARHGFVVVGGTAGDNEEGEPDLRLEWVPAAR